MFLAEEPTPPLEETPLSGDFWSGLAQFWADNWGIIVGKLIAIAVIIAVVFVLGILTYAGMIFSHARQKERSDAHATQVATPRDPMPDR